jgi:hypothetical protein
MAYTTELPEGGYCFDCRIAFVSERQADSHYNMTGHDVGWPFEYVNWPLATDVQTMPCPRCERGTVKHRTGDMWWQVQHLRCSWCRGTGRVLRKSPTHESPEDAA